MSHHPPEDEAQHRHNNDGHPLPTNQQLSDVLFASYPSQSPAPSSTGSHTSPMMNDGPPPPDLCPSSPSIVRPLHCNFVLDNPVPKNLLEFCVNRTEREFTHMRYSAATCDPNDFKHDGFTLRQAHYDPPRRTELFIVMTMHNEDEELFTRSMHGVIKNMAHLCQRNRSKTWGKDAWKKVVLCIVSDGRAKMNSGNLFTLAAMGCYQDDVAKLSISDRDVTAHIFEYTTQSPITPSPNIESSEKGVLPVQIIFCLKEKDKIDSHRWVFDAFEPILQPNVCALIDVGTTLGPTSFYHLWKAGSNVGGGVLTLKGKYGAKLGAIGDIIGEDHNAGDQSVEDDSDSG